MGQAKARKAEIAAIKNGNNTTEGIVYHYTKGMSLYSIFKDGFIATERKRGLSGAQKNTDCVWFTTKNTYPKTALPSIPAMPSTNLMAQFMQGNRAINLDELALHVAGVARLVFNTKLHSNIKKWSDSQTRISALQNPMWAMMEKIANKVGDDVNSYWYSNEDISLENVTLQTYKGGWIDVLSSFSVGALTEEQKAVVEALMNISEADLESKGLPLHHVIEA